jgi:hypothetical protein
VHGYGSEVRSFLHATEKYPASAEKVREDRCILGSRRFPSAHPIDLSARIRLFKTSPMPLALSRAAGHRFSFVSRRVSDAHDHLPIPLAARRRRCPRRHDRLGAYGWRGSRAWECPIVSHLDATPVAEQSGAESHRRAGQPHPETGCGCRRATAGRSQSVRLLRWCPRSSKLRSSSHARKRASTQAGDAVHHHRRLVTAEGSQDRKTTPANVGWLYVIRPDALCGFDTRERSCLDRCPTLR